MKANYLKSKSDQRRLATEVAREEIERQKKEVCSRCEDRIGHQVLAVAMKVLHDDFGFGEERLKRFTDSVGNLFYLCGADSKRFQAIDCVEWLKSKYGIDLEREE